MHGSELLRQWREREDITQTAAARRLGVGFKEYVAWESAEFGVDKNKRPTRERRPGLDAALLIERECGVPVEAWALDETLRPTGTG